MHNGHESGMSCGVLYSNYYNTITRDVEQPNFIPQNFKLKTLCSGLFVKS